MPIQNEHAVRCEGLAKTYGEGPGRVAALRGVDLDIYQGELLMLEGPSGCGKTTLISIIGAILRQDEGKCEVFGNDLRNMDDRQRLRFRGASVGFVFQLFHLLPALTVIENVSVPLLLNGVLRREAEERARALAESVGLSERVDALPSELSGGQQQRVAIARALVHSPKLVVCDEPTSNLDHETGHAIMEILLEIAQGPGRAIIVVTHDSRILGFADRIAHMDDGRIVDIAINDHRKPE